MLLVRKNVFISFLYIFFLLPFMAKTLYLSTLTSIAYNNMNLAEKIWNPQTAKNLCRRVNENVHKNAIEG